MQCSVATGFGLSIRVHKIVSWVMSDEVGFSDDR